MACQPDTGKVTRIATMLHEGAAMTRGRAALYLPWLCSSENNPKSGRRVDWPTGVIHHCLFPRDERGGLRYR
jgi:hypothetical protein